ncbi:hypothetical protein L1D53_26105, partial [Vibrio alginolyticus]|nr:hypothetical protein [Vibrio alginolyticus]
MQAALQSWFLTVHHTESIHKTMLKKWLDNMLPLRDLHQAGSVARHHLVLPVHHAAEKVLRDLHQAGFEAYLVGGA